MKKFTINYTYKRYTEWHKGSVEIEWGNNISIKDMKIIALDVLEEYEMCEVKLWEITEKAIKVSKWSRIKIHLGFIMDLLLITVAFWYILAFFYTDDLGYGINWVIFYLFYLSNRIDVLIDRK